MKTQSVDTNKEAEKKQIELARNANTAKKLAQVCSLSQITLHLAKRALLRNNKNLSEKEQNILFVANHYGKEIAANLKSYLDKIEYESS